MLNTTWLGSINSFTKLDSPASIRPLSLKTLGRNDNISLLCLNKVDTNKPRNDTTNKGIKEIVS